MLAMVTGRALGGNSYQRKSDKQTVLTVDLYDGRDVVRVNDVPSNAFEFGEEVTFPVRILSTDRGLYVSYANQK